MRAIALGAQSLKTRKKELDFFFIVSITGAVDLKSHLNYFFTKKKKKLTTICANKR